MLHIDLILILKLILKVRKRKIFPHDYHSNITHPVVQNFFPDMDRAVESQNGPPAIFVVSIGYLEVNKPNTNHRIIFGNLFTYNSVQPLDSIVWIFDRVAVSRGRSPRILGVPPKFLLPGGPETPFPALSDKYFCQKRFGS